MSNVYTRVTCIDTLEVPFIQRNRIYLFLSFFLFKRDIFWPKVSNCQYWSSATPSQSLEIYASTMYIAGIYTLSFYILLSTGYICTLLLLSLEAHFAPLGSINLARLTQSKTDNPLNKLYVSRGATVYATHTSIWSRVSTWSRLIELFAMEVVYQYKSYYHCLFPSTWWKLSHFTVRYRTVYDRLSLAFLSWQRPMLLTKKRNKSRISTKNKQE